MPLKFLPWTTGQEVVPVWQIKINGKGISLEKKRGDDSRNGHFSFISTPS